MVVNLRKPRHVCGVPANGRLGFRTDRAWGAAKLTHKVRLEIALAKVKIAIGFILKVQR